MACNVTVDADRYNPAGDTNGTKVDAVTATGSGAATASVPAATTFSVVTDGGGVSVRWTVDPNLIDSTMATVTLNCSQGSTKLVTDQRFIGSGGTFVTADTSGAVSCNAVTSITVPGGTTYENSSSPNTGSATPLPEEEVSGLPIWLLYVATQPKNLKDTISVGATATDMNASRPLDDSLSLGQGFTAGFTGSLQSVSFYVREGELNSSATGIIWLCLGWGRLTRQCVGDGDDLSWRYS